MDELANILKGRQPTQPPEIAAIKNYVLEHFKSQVAVAIRNNEIIITAPSASLANSLRLNSEDIAEVCGLSRRLIFRIG